MVTLVRDRATRSLSRRLWQPWLALLALVACGEPRPEHGQSSAPPHPSGLRARGLSAGFTLPDGRQRAVEIDAIEASPGRVLGLRAPVLDGLVLRGVRVSENGEIVEQRERVKVEPYDGLLRAHGRAQTPEIEALTATIGRLVAWPTPNRP